MRVLIIEDKTSLSDEITSFLKKQKFICDTAYTKRSAIEKILGNEYDVILLDLNLPDGDGLDILKEPKLTQESKDAIIVISAKGSSEEKIKGLNLGADDYLAKPFDLAELNARIHAVLRRKHGIVKNEIILHGFTIDIQNRTVTFGADEISLTKKEFDILTYLTINKNRVITRLQLTEHVWGDLLEVNSDSNFVDVHVKNLRKKLKQYAPAEWLETVRSIGYKISV